MTRATLAVLSLLAIGCGGESPTAPSTAPDLAVGGQRSVLPSTHAPGVRGIVVCDPWNPRGRSGYLLPLKGQCYGFGLYIQSYEPVFGGDSVVVTDASGTPTDVLRVRWYIVPSNEEFPLEFAEPYQRESLIDGSITPIAPVYIAPGIRRVNDAYSPNQWVEVSDAAPVDGIAEHRVYGVFQRKQ